MKVSFKIKEVRPRIFLFEFKDQYDMCMTFLRYQEFYESPNSKFRNKYFTILDFMEWYSKKGNETRKYFSYPIDWAGFNIPSNVMKKAFNCINDRNDYDRIMYAAYYKCAKKLENKYGVKDTPFYIIGAKKGAASTLEHEVAHGFFYTIPEYKKEMTKLVKKLNPKIYKDICALLKRLGYTPQVYVDECQAYMSTGGAARFGIKVGQSEKPFINLFKQYYNK